MKTYTFVKDWPVRLNERQDTTYLAGHSYPLDDETAGRAQVAGVLKAAELADDDKPRGKRSS